MLCPSHPQPGGAEQVSDIIPIDDLLMEVGNPNKGGQHVGVDCTVKITHLPSGLVAIVNCDRSQHRNKNIALDMIAGGLTSKHFR